MQKQRIRIRNPDNNESYLSSLNRASISIYIPNLLGIRGPKTFGNQELSRRIPCTLHRYIIRTTISVMFSGPSFIGCL